MCGTPSHDTRPVSRTTWLATAILAALLWSAGCDGNDGAPGPTGPAGPAGPAGPPGDGSQTEGAGLDFEILGVTIGADRKPMVEFTMADENGDPLGIEDLDGDPSFGLAYLQIDPDSGGGRYQSYIVRTATGADWTLDGMTMSPVLATAEQAGTDAGG